MRTPFSQQAADAAVLLFAGWTLCSHAAVLTGSDTHTLALLAGFALPLWVPLCVVLWRRAEHTAPAAQATPSVAPAAELGASGPLRWKLGVGAALLIGTWFAFRHPLTLWLAAVLFTVFAYALVARDTTPHPSQPSFGWERAHEAGLWALALAGGFLALFAHRWRNDDCYYINIAVTTADRPELPLLSVIDMHGPIEGGLSMIFPPYRLHSFEVLGGLVSHLTGISALEVIHLGLAGLFGLLIPLGIARLYRLLDGERWLWMVAVTIAFYLFEGSSGLSYGNQAFVRTFTGKSVMLSFALPMLIAYGMLFGMRPSWPRLFMLGAAQVTCLGLTSTSLWLAPAAAMLAVAVPLRLEPRSMRTLAWALLGSAYILVMALWVRGQMFASAEPSVAEAVTHVKGSRIYLRMDLLWSAFRRMFAEPGVALVYLSLIPVAIATCRTSLARRYLIVFCLALTVLLMNPYLANMLRHNVYGRFTGQRTMWIAPVPAALALCAVAVIPSAARRVHYLAAVATTVAALSLLFALVPTRWVLSRDNNVVYHWPPQPKVPSRSFSAARRVQEILPPESHVLAPEVVSWYLPTLHHHPYPVLANAKYMRTPQADREFRQQLVRWVDKKHATPMTPEEESTFREGLRHYDVDAVVVTREAINPRLRRLIKGSGYRFYKDFPGAFRFYVRR